MEAALESAVERALAKAGLLPDALETKLERVVLRVLESRSEKQWIGTRELAARIGRSAKGLERFLSRPQGASLRALATRTPGTNRWMWRTIDVDHWQREHQAGR